MILVCALDVVSWISVLQALEKSGGEVDGPRMDSIEIEELLPDEELLDEDSERCRRAMMIVVGKGISNAIYAICDITSFIWSC